MEPHEIIDATMGTNEAADLNKLTGKSPELFNSYRRPPRCPENPTATGNYSPLYHYKQYFHLRRAVNPEGALKMHHLLNQDIQDEVAGEPTNENLLKLLIQTMNKVMQTIDQLGVNDIEEASNNDLILVDELINEASESLSDARSRVRGERNRRKSKRFKKAS